MPKGNNFKDIVVTFPNPWRKRSHSKPRKHQPMRQLKITHNIASERNEQVEKYLGEISRNALLTAEEEGELAKRIRLDDQDALEVLVKANLRFVVSVAKQYQNQGLPLSDLINEGNLGLIRAARKFDETRGFKFISYAVFCLKKKKNEQSARIIQFPIANTKKTAVLTLQRIFSTLRGTAITTDLHQGLSTT